MILFCTPPETNKQTNRKKQKTKTSYVYLLVQATKRTSTVANIVIVIVNLLLPSYRWSVADLISRCCENGNLNHLYQKETCIILQTA